MAEPILTARKRTSILLNRCFPKTYVPTYTLISHSNTPYAHCVERARRQDRIARWLGADLLVGAVSLLVWAERIVAHTRARVTLKRKEQREASPQMTGWVPDESAEA